MADQGVRIVDLGNMFQTSRDVFAFPVMKAAIAADRKQIDAIAVEAITRLGLPLDICSGCGRKTWAFEVMSAETIGIQYGPEDEELLVLWVCPKCGSTQGWYCDVAPERVLDAARNVDLLRAMIAAPAPVAEIEA